MEPHNKVDSTGWVLWKTYITSHLSKGKTGKYAKNILLYFTTRYFEHLLQWSSHKGDKSGSQEENENLLQIIASGYSKKVKVLQDIVLKCWSSKKYL